MMTRALSGILFSNFMVNDFYNMIFINLIFINHIRSDYFLFGSVFIKKNNKKPKPVQTD
jgi:hypothetical protein